MWSASGCSDFRRTLGRSMGRRQLLHGGALSLLLPGVANVLAGRARGGERRVRIKSCLVLFQAGGVSQTDTFDMKPMAAEVVRGEFKPISTSVSGMHVCEHLPQVARQMDKLCVVRSLHHRMLCHNPAIYSALSGREVGESKAISSTTFASRDDFPHYGSVVARFLRHPDDLPASVSLPFALRNGPAPSPGQDAGFLGTAYDPMLIRQDPNADGFRVDELAVPEEVDASRLTGRQGLLTALDRGQRHLERSNAVDGLGEYYRQAFNLLTTSRAKRAFDLTEEDPRVRDRYGRNQTGQATLLGRRLVEAGVPFVTVYSPVQNIEGPSWDTHLNNFPMLKGDLLPPADQSLSALLHDLSASGLADEVLVVWMGEFGRTPRIGVVRSNNTSNATGRDHWPGCYSILLAGGGVRGGQYHGASDKEGWYPREDPVHVGDLAATIYDAFGIDPRSTIADAAGRPHRLAEGQPIQGIW
jgi:hypothetical protein